MVKFHGLKLLSAIALAIVTVSCSSVRSSRTEFSAIPDVDSTAGPIRNYLTPDEYKMTLELYSPSQKDGAGQNWVRKSLDAGHRLVKAADHAYGEKKFIKAGVIYKLLKESPISLESPKAFPAAYLETQIRACSQFLTEWGLEKYREEKLDQAIGIWRKILLFDPENQAVIKAVNTAHSQLQRLQNY